MNTEYFKAIYLFVLLTLSFFINNVQAQIKPAIYSIQGNVIDSTTLEPIAFATIKLLDSANTVFKVGLTNQEGNINISFEGTASFYLLATSTGYQPKTIFIQTTETKNVIDVKTILLQPGVKELTQAVVTSKVPIIKQEVDRIVYNLQADPDSKVKNTLEIMRKMPYLSMDAEENILLKGNKNFKIFINGKPSGLMENNPKDVLRSMPASTIQRIEIITNPSSKYDAEGAVGIINIVTIKKIGNGYNGSVNFYHKMPMANTGIGTSFTTKKGKWGLSCFAGVNYNELLPTYYSNNQISNNFSVTQNGQKRNEARSGYIGGNLSFELDSLNLITAQGSANFGINNGKDKQAVLFENNGVMAQQYKTNSQSNAKPNGVDAGINWQIGSRKNKSRLITISYQYLAFSNKQNNTVQLNDKVNFSEPNFKQYNKGFNNEHTFQTDFVQSFKSFYFEAGIKGIFRNNNSDFEYLKQNASNNSYERDNLGSNQFLSTQYIIGAYNNFRFAIRMWSFQAGYRIEQTDINAKFVTNATKVQQNYFNIIPSISINKALENKGNVNFGFSQRIKRPGINRLNPFVDRSNPNFINTGNPDLQPVINNDIMLGYSFSKRVSYNIGLGYSFSNNIDLKVATYDTTTNITTSIFRNTGKASRLGIDYNINCPLSDKFNIAINGNLAYFWINGFADDRPIRNNLFTYYLALTSGYRLKHDWQLNAELNAISENPSGLQSKTSGFVSFSFSVSKSVWNNKLSFSAYTKNPFAKFRENSITSFGYNFQQNNIVKEYFRSFGVSINYKFGKLNEELKRNRREIRNNDVSN